MLEFPADRHAGAEHYTRGLYRAHLRKHLRHPHTEKTQVQLKIGQRQPKIKEAEDPGQEPKAKGGAHTCRGRRQGESQATRGSRPPAKPGYSDDNPGPGPRTLVPARGRGRPGRFSRQRTQGTQRTTNAQKRPDLGHTDRPRRNITNQVWGILAQLHQQPWSSIGGGLRPPDKTTKVGIG